MKRPGEFRSTACLLALVFCVAPVLAQSIQVASPTAEGARHAVIGAPNFSQSKLGLLVNRIAIEMLLGNEYEEVPASDGVWKTQGIAGVGGVRYFRKNTVEGARRTIELVAIPGISGGYEIHLYGREDRNGLVTPNSDIGVLEQTVRRMVEADAVATPQSANAGGGGPGARDRLGHSIYELSYTQADRALATLKALGYSTVEFTGTPGESDYSKLYQASAAPDGSLPRIIKMIDSPKTSLMDKDPGNQGPPGMQMAPQFGAPERKAVPDIGGTFLHQATSGEPQQRLLILYDEAEPEPMERLLEILSEEIDVPAKQVVISALVLEINSNRAKELGAEFRVGNGRNAFSFEVDPQSGIQQPFTWIYDKGAESGTYLISATLKALIAKGEAEILSNPSVLVLDGRQARIQVGQQVPVVNSTSTSAGSFSSVEYFPVGIVLNLRPRISNDGSEVTMQIETIVSAVTQSSVSSEAVFFAPTVDNRQVQTFVRVADNTPFIIGGLISSDQKTSRSGIPWLSGLPLIGGLFRTDSSSSAKREVIVVLTPHVIPADDHSFSYVIPKDSSRFDSFGHLLFRNAYRIRTTDLYDLQFVHESAILKDLVERIRRRAEIDPSLKHTEPYSSLMEGNAPGEEILVNRMLWEIVKRSHYADKIDPKQILVFQPSPADPTGTDFEAAFLDRPLANLTSQNNALVLTFDAENRGSTEHPFSQPKAKISYEQVTKEAYAKRLIEANRRGPDGAPESWTIMLTDAYSGSTAPLDTLRNVLVLKKVLTLNSSLPKTIRGFSVGRQIIFPTEDDIEKSVHVVDHEVARLFYEIREYYRAFEQEFNRTTRNIMKEIGAGNSP